ncbi:MAG: peptidoglycan DD-metalloendopeptidase family protein [Bacillota bacterium]
MRLLNKNNTLIIIIIILALGISLFTGFRNTPQPKLQEPTYGYQFSVDGQAWFIVENKEELMQKLDEYKQRYLNNIDENAQIKSIDFKQIIEIIKVEVTDKQFNSIEEAMTKLNTNEKEAAFVEVKEGDNLWNIAKDNNLTVEQIEFINPDLNPEKIFPGDKILLAPADPLLDVIVKLENTITETVPFKTEYTKDTRLYQSQNQVIKEGVEGKKEVTYDITLLNGLKQDIKVLQETEILAPVNKVVKVGTKKTVSRSSSVNYGVVRGTRVSSQYGWRTHPITGKRSLHQGVDIAANYGTAIYAYTEGKVIQAGWDGGYGKSVIIDHGNGLKTRYAHMSNIFVNVGERVVTAQRIGAVGSTGNSTGNHVHFEVTKDGETQNPWNYI